MKLILHIGLPKTGSSSLQRTLEQSNGYLQQKRVLYPKNPPYLKDAAHMLLALSIAPVSALAGNIKRFVENSPMNSEEILEHYVDNILQQIKENDPVCTILSSEYMSKPIETENSILSSISRISEDVSIVIYLREPAAHFASIIQQRYKHDHRRSSIPRISFLKVIESYQKIFGSDRVTVKLFERSALHNSDLVADFCHNFLADFGIRFEDLKSVRGNVSMSAEGLSIVRDFRREFFRDAPNINKKASLKIVAEIRKIDSLLDTPSTKLRPNIRRIVQKLSDADLLQDRLGITFDDFSYCSDALSAVDMSYADGKYELEDLVGIDKDVRSDILKHLASGPLVEDPYYSSWILQHFKASARGRKGVK